MVLRQRIAHASEYRVTQNPNDTGGWDPLENLFYSDRLPCTECISDARLTKYATDEARNSMINAITNHSIPAAGVKSVEDCTATKLVTDFRAKPFMGLAQGTLNTAITTCWKQYWQ
ncbi:MAG: hypothetical protein ACRET4_15330 [Steroidobacteraceae bacterium]